MDNENLNRLAHLYNEQYYTAHHSNNDVYRRNQVKIDPINIFLKRNTEEYSTFIDVEIRVSALMPNAINYLNKNMKEVKWEGKLQDWYQALLNNALEMASK